MAVGVADLLGDWVSSARRSLRTRQARLLVFRLAVVAVAGLAAALSDAAPTGYDALDKAYVAALAGGTAYLAGTARRWTWFFPAGIGAVLADDGVAIALAAAGLAIGFWSVLSDTRSPARAAVVVGLGVASCLLAGPVAFQGASAIVVGVFLLPVAVSGYRNAGRASRHRVRQVALAAGVLCGLTLAGGALALVLVGNDLVDGMDLADQGIVAARDADDDLASQRLTEAARLLDASSTTLESWFVSPARGLPIIGPNLQAVEQLTDDVGDLASASAAAADAADVDQLRLAGGRLAPEAVENVGASLDTVAGSVRRAQASVDDVESPWLLSPVSDRMADLSTELSENLPDVTSARDAVHVVHDLLAPGGSRRYLVLFVTPVEARGRTGFPGNYAELLVEDGTITMPRFGRITELEAANPGVPRTIAAPGTEDYVARYGPFHPQDTWRNLTMSPDLPTIARVAAELYPQSGGTEIDGLLTVDPTGLAALMRFTDPVIVPEIPVPLTADNTEDFLHLHQYVAYPEASQRVDALGSVAEQTFRQLLSAELPDPQELVDVLAPAVKGGHIQFTTFVEGEQAYFDRIGISGAFTSRAGQVTSVVTNNASGNKVDLFLQRSLRFDGTFDPATNMVAGKITVQLRNSAEPESSLPDYVVGNLVGLPEGWNRSYVSVYTSQRMDGARIDGQPAAMSAQAELGANVYSTFVDIPPKGTITIELDVSGPTLLPGLFSTRFLGQPLVETEQVEFNLTVAGDGAIDTEALGADVTVEGRTVHWNGPLTEPVEIFVDTTGVLSTPEARAMVSGEAP
ncbi:MAG TPA: DUF4012 domain-containing protein [Acidimicrobiales bacterium]|nr:DUF4012 domain-containing protein [Acidimicrobiales bacterium]